ncbi:uncharacterized protein K460DRAFT_354606 [Cucurbitaria berberidis CBS 394.84]|uniref:Uncharacterized protein n=1 Tax=Cucurbitaria berberidis CBS 394.84 TaxID=1168544 RepID=A0A9P4GGC2_9PLEO|nr:uncharacterized protein K460DRAFT_354606 [Cucurbitaria berberidis CBS 394.84]KAF1844719.1 hypothetical protein K460DRAFT_354606 [Cucurbitaria berberidis CBS 394.84]
MTQDATMEGVVQEAISIPIADENILPDSAHLNDTTAASMEGTDQIMTNISENATPDEDWRASVDFDVPDSTQARITDLPKIQSLYDAYHTAYTDSAITNATRMRHAKALAFVLLKHYYPSQDYVIEPSALGPVAKRQMNFIKVADDGSDVWQDLPAKKPAKKGKKKGSLTKKQKEAAEIVAKTDEYNHGLRYVSNLQWVRIEPEDIAGFVVLRKVKNTDKETGIGKDEYRPHTYLAIMIDNFDELPRFSTANTTHRSDVLADALCMGSKIRDGYGILLYGARIEFYRYEPGTDWTYYESDDDTASRTLADGTFDDDVQDIEPAMLPVSDEDGTEVLAMDMRTTSLPAVDEGFKRIATMKVTYVDDVVDVAVKQPSYR